MNKVNLQTPFNYQNRLLPQPTRGNILTGNLFLSYGSISTSMNLVTLTDDARKPDYQYSLRELACDFSLSDNIDITIGKKILKWGTGYAFNPTGVVEPQRTPSDPSDRLGQNDGRKILAVNVFSDKSSITVVYLNDVRVESSRLHWGRQEIAARVSTIVRGLDLALVGHYMEGDRLEAGLNWSYVVGENLELHGEALGKKGTSALYHPAVVSDIVGQMFASDPSAPLYEHSDRIFQKFLIGAQYTFDNGANLAIEYYHNGEGLSKSEWNQWMKFVKFHNSIQQGLIAEPPVLVELSKYNLLWALRMLSPRGTMSDYLFGREYYSTGRWSFEFLQLLNVLDVSAVIVPSASLRLSEYVSVYGRLTSFIGGSETEYGALFDRVTLNLGIRFQL